MAEPNSTGRPANRAHRLRGLLKGLRPSRSWATADDNASNESSYPENEIEYHTVTLDSSVDRDYVHDANGCLIRIEEASTVLTEYVYDYENRLIEVQHEGATVAEYQYDGLGRRVWSNVGGVETRYI